MKYIPLANLRNATGIVAFFKDVNEIVVANKNGQPKFVLMSRTVYKNGFGKVMDYESYRMRKDYLTDMVKK